jgi:hypothetical protein
VLFFPACPYSCINARGRVGLFGGVLLSWRPSFQDSQPNARTVPRCHVLPMTLLSEIQCSIELEVNARSHVLSRIRVSRRNPYAGETYRTRSLNSLRDCPVACSGRRLGASEPLQGGLAQVLSPRNRETSKTHIAK